MKENRDILIAQLKTDLTKKNMHMEEPIYHFCE